MKKLYDAPKMDAQNLSSLDVIASSTISSRTDGTGYSLDFSVKDGWTQIE